jgi:hypothetical protein
MVEYIHFLLLCTSSTLGLLPVSRLASRKILTEQNIKRRTGPALYVISLLAGRAGVPVQNIIFRPVKPKCYSI